jgi:hypothetical protein
MGGGASGQGLSADALAGSGKCRAADARDLFRLLASAAPGGFDVEAAACLELDWWQARREAVGPEQYGLTVARVAAITYGKQPDAPSLVISGIGRAEAMAYRDARGQVMTDQDWSEIERRLRRAYQSLEAAVGGG